MRKIIARFVVVLMFCSSISAAHAQMMIDQAIGGAIGGGSEMGAIPKTSAPPSVITDNLQRQGYTDIGPIIPTAIGTTMMVSATSPAGNPVTLSIDPLTGKVMSAAPK